MDKKENVSWLIPALAFVFVVSVWSISLYFLYNMEKRGTFGDMFGAVNALFSGLAFAGVIIAILLQKTELSLQRNELELTRNELKGQRAEMEIQNKTLLKQSFENTFFQLLSLQQEIVNSIDLAASGSRETSGRHCFNVFYSKFREMWNNTPETKSPINSDVDESEIIKLVYAKFYDKYQGEIGHYFRSLYHIVKFVDGSEIDNKRLYTNLVRAQLSSFELALLFYNCLSDFGHEKFKPLVEKYALLKNMPRSPIIIRQEHKGLYAPSAYE